MKNSNYSELSKEWRERRERRDGGREGREEREGRGGRGVVVYVCGRGEEGEGEEWRKGALEGMEDDQSQDTVDRLKFESQFESGNLSQAIQM